MSLVTRKNKKETWEAFLAKRLDGKTSSDILTITNHVTDPKCLLILDEFPKAYRLPESDGLCFVKKSHV